MTRSLGSASLPHRYPFRLVDTVLVERNADFSSGTVRARISANARSSADGFWDSPLLLAEAIAQSALLLEGGDAELAESGRLAGIEGFEVVRRPQPGETLDIDIRLSAAFGGIARFEGRIRSQDEMLASGSVLVRRGRAPSIA